MVSAEAVAAAVAKSLGFVIGDVVGSGSYKYTFRIQSGDDVKALKLYNRSGVNARSLREIEAMRRCDHPNIAKLVGIDTFVFDGAEFTYLLEEYLEGGTLTPRVGRLQRSDLCSIAASLSDALCHLTDLRLVHRDLKPDNVMFRDATSSSPVIVDFGLVRDLGDTSLTATWLEKGPGSPFFSAPEQLNNEKGLIDWRTDQFGLGATLAIAFYGDHPYRADPRESNDAVLERVASKASLPAPFTKRCSADGLDVLSRMAYAKRFTAEQYKFVIDVGSEFARAARGKKFTAMQSVIVNMAAVNDARAALALASIISATECPWVYLMFRSENQDPRRELAEADELLGAMYLISALERADIRVMVAYSSSDMLLWKAAGATACATGKFFNVRRFTKSRFDPPKKGGGNLAYWFEESLLAFLRQADLLKLDKAGLLSAASKRNHFFLQVLTRARANKPWKAQSWRQFMNWFADAESRLNEGTTTARQLIERAQKNWEKVTELKLYPEEPENRGAWLREWRDALDHFEGRKSGTDSAA